METNIKGSVTAVKKSSFILNLLALVSCLVLMIILINLVAMLINHTDPKELISYVVIGPTLAFITSGVFFVLSILIYKEINKKDDWRFPWPIWITNGVLFLITLFLLIFISREGEISMSFPLG